MLSTPVTVILCPLLLCGGWLFGVSGRHPSTLFRSFNGDCMWVLLSGDIPCSNSPSFFQVFSSDRAAQALTVQMACAFEQLVVLFKHWLDDSPPGTSSARLEDELRQDIKKLGGYLQLFLQVPWFFLNNSCVLKVFIELSTTCIFPKITSEYFWVLPVLGS